MKKINFYKLQASGNDFILIDTIADKSLKKIAYSKLAKSICERKLGIGADGLLVIEPSAKADFKMRIINSDGSEAEMCGNGARCSAFWYNLKYSKNKTKPVSFETKAGIIISQIESSFSKNLSVKQSVSIKIKTTDPFDIKQDIRLKIFERALDVNFINSGVPHAVIFVEGLEGIDVEEIGREIRFHEQFSPAGTNVDFVQILGENSIKIRTYERGVEAETLACGTGSIASAVISSFKIKPQVSKETIFVQVKVKSGETLKVYFDRDKNKVSNVWLEGKASLVYKGEFVL